MSLYYIAEVEGVHFIKPVLIYFSYSFFKADLGILLEFWIKNFLIC